MAIVSLLLLIALTQSIKSSNKLLIKSLVRRSAPKCYKHTTSFHPHILCSLVLQMQLGASHKVKKIKYIKQKHKSMQKHYKYKLFVKYTN